MLKPAGETTVEDLAGKVTRYPVYSCDECLQTVDFGGEKFEQALTFALRPDGTVVDPAEPDGELKF